MFAVSNCGAAVVVALCDSIFIKDVFEWQINFLVKHGVVQNYLDLVS